MAIHFEYSLAYLKKMFGASNKILMDISTLYSNYAFLNKIEKKVDTHVFELKSYKNTVESTLAVINSFHTDTSATIKQKIIANSMFASFCQEFHAISAFIKEELVLNDVDAYLCTWQFISVKLAMRGNYKRALQYADYLNKKKNLDNTLKEINPFSDRFRII